MRAMRGLWIAFCLLLAPGFLSACHCVVSWSVCQEVAASNVVFVGTVDTIQPRPSASQGTRIRFRVRSVFQQKENLDTAKFIDVWNEPGDCGIPFQKGETYLVYATDDEESDHLETGVCRRTIRLTDAGEDLAYLYFVQSGGAEANRLEGFVTSEIEQLQQDRFHYTGKVKSPVSNVVIELKSANGARYTETDPAGRFVFDGLADGEYRASAFEAGFPDRVKLLSGPKRVDVRKGKCATTALLVLVREANR